MDNKILIYLKNNYLKNNKINNFLNAYITECLICFSELDNNSIIMINKFCKCYENCFLCEKCFIKWITINPKCFICHYKYTNDNISTIKKPIFFFYVPLLKYKLESSMEKKNIEYIKNLITRTRENNISDRSINLNDSYTLNQTFSKDNFFSFIIIACLITFIFSIYFIISGLY
mgnify:CR=1 FL=1